MFLAFRKKAVLFFAFFIQTLSLCSQTLDIGISPLADNLSEETCQEACCNKQEETPQETNKELETKQKACACTTNNAPSGQNGFVRVLDNQIKKTFDASLKNINTPNHSDKNSYWKIVLACNQTINVRTRVAQKNMASRPPPLLYLVHTHLAI